VFAAGDVLPPLVGQVFEPNLAGHRPAPVAVAEVVVVGAEDGLERGLTLPLVAAAQVHAGDEQGLGEGVVEDDLGGAAAEFAVVRAGEFGEFAGLLGGEPDLAGDAVPRRPLGAEPGRAGEELVDDGVVGVIGIGHDSSPQAVRSELIYTPLGIGRVKRDF
jgi:hypothetical protein